MTVAAIYKTIPKIKERLSFFDVTREELQTVALAALAARNDATSLHPINASGTFSYMAGVAALRDVFQKKPGWYMARPNGLEAVIHKEFGVTIVFQNVDSACGAIEPNAISCKGEGARKLVNNPAKYLFEFMELEDKLKENHQIWFFCVSSHEGDTKVKAELSRPSTIESGQFGEFADRIFVFQDSDWPDWNPTDNPENEESTEEEIEIKVSKKSDV